MAKPGRPSKLAPEVKARILAAYQCGATDRGAAAAGGLSFPAIFEWLKIGQEHLDAGRNTIHSRFLNETTHARELGEALLLQRISQASKPRPVTKTRTRTYFRGKGPKKVKVVETTVEEVEEDGDWRAAQFLLAVRKPHLYSRRAIIENKLSGSVGVTTEERKTAEEILKSPEVRRELERIRLAALVGSGGEVAEPGSNGDGSNGRKVAAGAASRLPKQPPG